MKIIICDMKLKILLTKRQTSLFHLKKNTFIYIFLMIKKLNDHTDTHQRKITNFTNGE